MTDRVPPPFTADERTMLVSYLEFGRATLRTKCAGLTPEQLRRAAAPPAELTLLGLVRHAAEVERGWFRQGLAREEVANIWVTDEDPDAEFHVAGADVAEAFDTWDAEVARSREVLARFGLDDTFPDERRGSVSVRWLLLHLIEEYARHNGHADLLREAIDGRTGS
jgi:hypothetical protein